MRPNSSSLNLLGCLIVLGLAALGTLAAVFVLAPSLLPAALQPPTLPPLVPTLGFPTTPPPAQGFPTLPPEWTLTPVSPPTATPPPASPTPDFTTTPVVGGVTALPTSNVTSASGIDAQVAANAQGLRLRQLPGTAGRITAFLESLTPLQVVGRTPDNLWLEVVTPQQQRGWVMSEFLDVYVNLVGVPTTAGAALEASPTAVATGEARVAAGSDNLRLRAGPGTAGQILDLLPSGLILDLQGRTADNVWLQVVTEDHQSGWVMAQYVEAFIPIGSLPVTGTAVNATAAPGSATQIGYVPPLPTATLVPPLTATPLPPTFTPPPTWTPPPPPPTTSGPIGGYVDGAYIAGISQHARDIFLAGRERGNRANVFSKVGDSITVSGQFLFPIGSGHYDLRGYGQLAEVVAHFSSGWARTGNSFYNTSLAAKGGWSSWSVLSPSLADKTVCGAYESPLLCEYRVSRPAVALIMVGTNDVLGTPSDAYRANLRRIVGDTVDLGIIPVVSTIPPFLRTGYEARADELNGIIVAVAQEFDVPVWHYWAALQPLPNRGLAPDGVHPSWSPGPADFTAENLRYGYTVRNLTALQALDLLWRQCMQ